MKTSIFSLIFFTLFLFVIPVSANTATGTHEIVKTDPGKSEKSFSAAGKDLGPRKKKKNKKKRKNYLDRKVKMRNGHSCPSF